MPKTYAELIPTKDVAALLGISVRQVNRRTGKDFIPVVTGPGRTGARLFDKAEIQALLTPQSSSSVTDIPTGTRSEGGRFTSTGEVG